MQNTEHLCMGCMSETGDEQICSVCGFDEASYNQPDALALRTLLAGRYLVGKVVSKNGEGFTYLGFDTVTESVVKISEYFPSGLCKRSSGGVVEINGETAFAYNGGIIKYINLNKKLGLLSDVSAIYRVIDIFETNKTAYCISEYLPGIPLKEFLIRNGGFLNWEQVKPLFLPLITVMKSLHANDIIHGGISPETLIVGRDGRIRISGFCIHDIRKSNTEFEPQLFAGFAAVEQYRGEDLTTGTDVYGLAATMFRTLTGSPPPDAQQRMVQDNMTFPKSIAESIPRSVLVTMADALQLEPVDRSSNMDEFKSDLQVSAEVEYVTNEKETSNFGSGKTSTGKYTLIASLATAVVLLIIVFVVYLVTFGKNEAAESSSYSAMPSTVSIGDIGQSEKPESYFSVPDFSGNTYAALLENEEYQKWFDFKIVRKEYNDKFSKGQICAQSVKVGTSAKKDTVVELVISLGPSEITLPRRLKGMSKTEAYITLLELGFEPANIEFIEKKDNTPTEQEVVLETTPALGEKVSIDSSVIIYYNSNLITDEPYVQDDDNVDTD